MLTQKEIKAIRFYEGDVRKQDGESGELEEGFWGIPYVYKTMNCLLYDGLENEKERITEDIDKFRPEVFLEIEKIVDIFCDIFRAMYKSLEVFEKSESNRKTFLTVYRTERAASVKEMKRLKRTLSFTSTSKESRPEQFFCHKRGLTLLEILLPPCIPCLDFEKVLGESYYYANQREILLPPFLKISLCEGKLTEEEKGYKDAEGNPPRGKYIVVIEGIELQEKGGFWQEEIPELDELVKDKEVIVGILKKFVKEKELSGNEIKQYNLWKRKFKRIIMAKFEDIEKEWQKTRGIGKSRRAQLIDEIKERITEFDVCRKKYKTNMRVCNMALAAIGVVPMACMSLSFIQGAETVMRVAAIITSACSILLTRIVKVEVYPIKLYQRTRTCLNLRTLLREIKYEHNWNDETEDEYVQKFHKIMNEDTEISLRNLQYQIDNEEDFFQNDIIS